MEPEVALYWRTLCKHLQTEAQTKGSDAAMTSGTEAAVYAAEASDSHDLLDRILPTAVSEYVELVKTHTTAGSNYRFVSRQLLLLGALYDFSDVANRKVASAFVLQLLNSPLQYETDDEGNKVIIGDGISLGGEKDWAHAVSGLARKVHAAAGEFEEVVLGVVEELARPCWERTADFLQWLHCLSVTALLLENTKSFRWMHGKPYGATELLHTLLLPGAKHAHLDVQRAATRCLGLFGLLERNSSEELVKQLRLSFVTGPSPVSSMAGKALFDLGMWHGPQEIDKAMNHSLSSQFLGHANSFQPVYLNDTNEDLEVGLLDLLYAGLDTKNWKNSGDVDENESVQAVLAEGFAKVLLLSESYPSMSASSHPVLLAKLVNLYFCSETAELHSLSRLKQCLSVFFEHYPSLSVKHKKCILKAFIPAIRSMWPGINGNTSGSPVMVSNMRKRAVQASWFMLQMFQAPLYARGTEDAGENCRTNTSENLGNSISDFENGEEGLAICIAVEVASFQFKKSAAEKAYIAAISRILASLHFRVSEQGAIKLMRMLLNRVAESVSTEKEIVKELIKMAEILKTLDRDPDLRLLQDEANTMLGRLNLEYNLDEDGTSSMELPPTPVTRSTRPTRGRRKVKRDEESSSSDGEEFSPTSVVPSNPAVLSTRSERASKTAALSKLSTANKPARITEEESDGELSDVTSVDDSDESDQSCE